MPPDYPALEGPGPAAVCQGQLLPRHLVQHYIPPLPALAHIFQHLPAQRAPCRGLLLSLPHRLPQRSPRCVTLWACETAHVFNQDQQCHMTSLARPTPSITLTPTAHQVHCLTNEIWPTTSGTYLAQQLHAKVCCCPTTCCNNNPNPCATWLSGPQPSIIESLPGPAAPCQGLLLSLPRLLPQRWPRCVHTWGM
jgi:hypothetical protein